MAKHLHDRRYSYYSESMCRTKVAPPAEYSCTLSIRHEWTSYTCKNEQHRLYIIRQMWSVNDSSQAVIDVKLLAFPLAAWSRSSHAPELFSISVFQLRMTASEQRHEGKSQIDIN